MRLWFAAFLSFLCLALVLFLAEGWFRFQFGTICNQADSIYHHRFIPNRSCLVKTSEFSVTYHINSLSLRDEEVTIPKPQGTFRILMVGDSFTEGAGVAHEETFSSLLKEDSLDVINAGLSGTSPLLWYLWLRDQGLGLQPDMVILNVNETDLAEEQKFHSLKITDSQGEIVAVPGRPLRFLPEKLSTFLETHSRLYLYLIERPLPKLLRWKARLFSSKDNSQTQASIQTLANSPQVYLQLWKLLEADLTKISSLLQSRGIPFIVVVQPMGHQVDPLAWPGRQALGLEMGKVYPLPLFDDFLEAGQREGFPVVDLRSAFSQQPSRLYYSQDGHWTAQGHEVAAVAIKEFLTQQKYLK